MAGARAAALLLVSLVSVGSLLSAAVPASAGPDPRTPNAGLSPDATFPLFDPFIYDDVVLLGNNNSQISRNLTAHFQQVHQVPSNNVFYADLPTGETLSEANWVAFAAWFEGEMANRSLGSDINYIVTFKGMPIRVAWSGPNGPTSFQDALMLLGGTYESVIGSANLHGNPYFNSTARFSFAEFGFRLVTGIYAYNESTAMALIDRAANSLGSRGEFVLDADASKGFAGGWGSYGYANAALVWANATLSAAGEPVFLDTTNTYITGRSNAIGYSSWGSNDCCWGSVTQVAKPQNTWVNGSIAESFVSTGGRTFTWPPSYGQSLIADWIDEGVNGMKGYTDEPYINAIADGHILYGRYIAGYNMAESFWAASHVVGWRQIVIGDPKMAAFYPQDRDLAANASLLAAPAWVEEGLAGNITVGVDNTGLVDEEVGVDLYLGGHFLSSTLLSVPAHTAAAYTLSMDTAALPPGVWGNLALDVVFDAAGAIPEKDEANNNGSAAVEVRRAPIANVLLERTSALTMEPINLTLGVDRADRAIASFEVELDGALDATVPAVGNAAVYSSTFPRAGWHNISVVAVDIDNLRSVAAGPFSFRIVNRAPTAVIIANSTNPMSLVPVTFQALASRDPEGTAMTQLWDAGAFGTGIGPTFTVTFARPGVHAVVVTVTDEDGDSGSDVIEIDVVNRPPTAVVAANVSSVLTLLPVAFSAVGSADMDGTLASYAFLFDDGARIVLSTANATHAFARPGETGLWLEVTDDWGATARARLLLTIENRPPAAAWAAGSNFSAVEGLPWSAVLEASDADGNVTSYRVEFGDGGSLQGSPSEAQVAVPISRTFAVEGEYTLEVTVVDEFGGRFEFTRPITVTHPAPALNSVEIAGSDLNLSVDFDVETPYPLVTIRVRLDGRVVGSFDGAPAGTMAFALPAGTAPGNHTLLVEADDGTKTTVLAERNWVVAEPPFTPVTPPPPPPGEPAAGFSPVVIGAAVAAASLGAGLFFVMRRRKPE